MDYAREGFRTAFQSARKGGLTGPYTTDFNAAMHLKTAIDILKNRIVHEVRGDCLNGMYENRGHLGFKGKLGILKDGVYTRLAK